MQLNSEHNDKPGEMTEGTVEEKSAEEKFHPSDYGKMADSLLDLVDKTGGLKKNLYG